MSDNAHLEPGPRSAGVVEETGVVVGKPVDQEKVEASVAVIVTARRRRIIDHGRLDLARRLEARQPIADSDVPENERGHDAVIEPGAEMKMSGQPSLSKSWISTWGQRAGTMSA